MRASEPGRVSLRWLVRALCLSLGWGWGSSVALDAPTAQASCWPSTTATASTEAHATADVDTGPASSARGVLGLPSGGLVALPRHRAPDETCDQQELRVQIKLSTDNQFLLVST